MAVEENVTGNSVPGEPERVELIPYEFRDVPPIGRAQLPNGNGSILHQNPFQWSSRILLVFQFFEQFAESLFFFFTFKMQVLRKQAVLDGTPILGMLAILLYALSALSLRGRGVVAAGS